MVKKITGKEFDNEVKSGVVLVDFSAQWCGPCKMMEPVLEELSEEMGDSIKFYNADVDVERNLAGKFNIMNIPALIVMKDGDVVDTLVGFRPKTSLADELKKYI